MSLKLSALAAALTLLGASTAFAADPAAGELNDEALKLEWAGGPFVVPNVSPDAGEPVCPAGVPQFCDPYALTVNITDEFRELPENQRESVRFAISFDVTVPVTDYEIYVYDANGALVAEASNGPGVQESLSVPLKTLKNGSYTVTVVPYAPFATSYAAVAQIGKDAPAAMARASDASMGGAFGPAALLLLSGLGLVRMARRR